MLIAMSCQHQPLLWIFLLLLPLLLFLLLLLLVVVVVVVVVVVGLVVGSFRSTLTNEYGRQSANIFDLVSIVQLSRIGLLILHLFKMSPKSPKNLPTINELPHNVCYTSTRTTFE